MDKLRKIQNCKSCNLCNNQAPLLDTFKEAKVFWTGLSAVKVNNVKLDTPLSSNTNSGKLISTIENENNELTFYKTNLVKCLPLEQDKIRYPKTAEMKSCYKNLQEEISYSKPKIVFLLGKLVSDFILNMESTVSSKLDEQFNYKCHKIDDVNYIPIHHPSYILVYKRKLMDKYISKIGELAVSMV